MVSINITNIQKQNKKFLTQIIFYKNHSIKLKINQFAFLTFKKKFLKSILLAAAFSFFSALVDLETDGVVGFYYYYYYF